MRTTFVTDTCRAAAINGDINLFLNVVNAKDSTVEKNRAHGTATIIIVPVARCWQQHKKPDTTPKKTPTKTTCTICRRFTKYDATYEIRRGRPHRCHYRYCDRCKTEQHKDHRCYMQPYRPKKKKITRYVFFDFEWMVDDVHGGQHVPNYCVVHKVCKSCMDRQRLPCRMRTTSDNISWDCDTMHFRRVFMEKVGLDPSSEVMTIAQACQLVFRQQFLQPNTIAIVPHGGYGQGDKQSKKSLQWLAWVKHTTGVTIAHARNGGDKRFGRDKVDGYCKDNDTVY